MRIQCSSIVLCVLFALPGCAKSEAGKDKNPEPSAEPAASLPAPASSRPRAHDRGRPRGRWASRPERLLSAAQDGLTLSEQQKSKLDALDARVQQGSRGDDEGRAFREALAASAKAGTVDTKTLGERVKAIEVAVETKSAETAKVLNELYAALDPAQRKTVVDTVRKEQAERAARPNTPPARPNPSGNERAKRRAERVTRDLGLDEKQSKKLEAIEAKWGEVQLEPMKLEELRKDADKRLAALLDAFEKENFDASTFDLAPVSPKSSRERAEREVERMKALLPILTPEQRTKLADSMSRGFGFGRGPRLAPGERPRPAASP